MYAGIPDQIVHHWASPSLHPEFGGANRIPRMDVQYSISGFETLNCPFFSRLRRLLWISLLDESIQCRRWRPSSRSCERPLATRWTKRCLAGKAASRRFTRAKTGARSERRQATTTTCGRRPRTFAIVTIATGVTEVALAPRSGAVSA